MRTRAARLVRATATVVTALVERGGGAIGSTRAGVAEAAARATVTGGARLTDGATTATTGEGEVAAGSGCATANHAAVNTDASAAPSPSFHSTSVRSSFGGARLGFGAVGWAG